VWGWLGVLVVVVVVLGRGGGSAPSLLLRLMPK